MVRAKEPSVVRSRIGTVAWSTIVCASTAAALASTAHAQLSFEGGATAELGEPEPKRVAIGDLNGDGHLDIIVTCWGSDSSAGAIAIWTGDGAGGVVDDMSLPGPAHPWGVLVADLNADGRPDLAATNGTGAGNSVFVYFNNTAPGIVTPSFLAPVVLTAGGFPIGIGHGDVNGDDIQDLVVANNTSSHLSVFIGLGGNSFQSALSVGGPSNATGIEVADLDDDGLVDLAVPHYGGVAIFKGLATGSFQSSGGVMSGSLSSSACIGDFDGDGVPDVAGAAQYGDFIRLHHGDGALGFSMIGTWSTPAWPADLVAADLNGDGRDDAASPCLDGNTLAFVVSGASWSTQTLPTPYFQPSGIAAGDMNEDGRPDIVHAMRNLGESSQVQILLNSTEFPTPCVPEDLDCSGTVDGSDLGMLLGQWGACTECASDFDHDGVVDGSDLGTLLGAWG